MTHPTAPAAPAPTADLIVTLTVEHSSHPDYLFVSYARMTGMTGQRTTHHDDAASADAHIERVRTLAARGDLDFALIDRR